MILSLAGERREALLPWVGEILVKAGTFPFFTQLLCWYVWEQMEGSHPLTPEQFHRASERFSGQARPHFEYFLARLDPEERRVLEQMAANEVLNPAERILLHLEQLSLVVSADSKPHLFSEAFREFLLEAIPSPHNRESKETGPVPERE